MSQPQTISVADLDISQLAEVRKQLEEVRRKRYQIEESLTNYRLGIKSPHQLFCSAQASAGQVQDLYTEHRRNKAR